jgi:hypothetical protein
MQHSDRQNVNDMANVLSSMTVTFDEMVALQAILSGQTLDEARAHLIEVFRPVVEEFTRVMLKAARDLGIEEGTQ